MNKIVKDSLLEPDTFNYVKLNSNDVTVKEIIDNCLEVPFLTNKKVVVVDDASFFTNSYDTSLYTEKDIDNFAKFLKNPIEETDIVFLVYSDELNQRGKLYKAIKDTAKISFFKLFNEAEWLAILEDIATKRHFELTKDAKRELAHRTLNDRDKLLNELEKLSIYHDLITLNDVIALVDSPIEERGFMIVNGLLKGDTKSSLVIYKDLLSSGYDPNTLLSVLLSQFRYYFLVNYFYDNKKTSSEIASLTGSSEGRVRVTISTSRRIKNKITNILDDLYKLDYKIKSSQVDRFLGFELFLINFKTYYL